MKKALVIVVLLTFVMGCAVYTQGPQPPPAPEKAIANRIVAQVDSFSALISTRFLPAAQNPKTGPEKLRQLFLESRLAYKKFEWAAEYFTAATTRTVNGPPVAETQLSGFEIAPGGLQVIEGLLYPKYDPGDRQELIRQLHSLNVSCNLYRNYYQGTVILGRQIWDAAKLEVFRVTALGIAGFDAQLAKSGLAESACNLRSVGQVLAVYQITNGNDLTVKFNKAIQNLEAGSDFDSFDRAAFIITYADPLTVAINQAQQRFKVPQTIARRLLRPNAATLFDTSAFDASAYAPYPENDLSASRAVLGKKLFNDPSISGTGTRSCASCHKPENAFTDGLATNSALDNGSPLKRNTPTLLNAAFQPAQFADLRANSLEDQAHQVIESKGEMRGSLSQVSKLARNPGYSRLFAAAYPGSEKTGIGKKEITGALSAYIRTLSVLNSRFDTYMRGDAEAMNQDEVSGFNLFMGKAKCGTCHYMPLFNGALPPTYQKMDAEIIGVPASLNSSQIDADRGRNAITHAIADNYAFKIPSIRNAARTAPYMHNGVFTTLEQVVDFYNNGGGAGMGIKIPNQSLSTEPLKLSVKEKRELIAFIKCLDNK